MKINFQKIKLQNFMSYQKEQEYEFKRGLSLITSKNGNGKSVIFTALYYALFGKTNRGKKINDLINNNINKNLLVTLYFNIEDNNYKVIRGIKPNIFEIYKNDDLIDINSSVKEYQKILDDIIQFDELIFNQLLYLGANITESKNFMELNTKEKEKVFQILMDTTYFNELSMKSKEYKKHLKNEIIKFEMLVDTNKNDIDILQKQIRESEEHNKIIKEQRENLINKNNSTIEEKELEISNNENKLNDINNYLDELYNKEKVLNNSYNELLEGLKDKLKIEVKQIQDIIKEIDNNLHVKENEIQDIKINIKNYKKAEKEKIVCNKCGNEIKQHFNFNYEDEIKKGKQLKLEIDELKKEKDTLNNNILKLKNNFINEKNKLQDKFSINKLDTEISTNKKEKEHLEKQIEIAKNHITKLKNDILHLQNMKEKDIDYNLLKNKEDTINKLESNIIEYKNKLNLLDEFINLISDENLKGQFIEKHLPLLNYHINQYIVKFGLPYNFILDKKFNEKIIYGNYELSFGQLSNGQKMRIITAILFAFLKLSEEKANVSFNLLILDEYINGSLDVDGVEDILKILKYQFNDKDIVLITHNSDIKNSEIFDNTIKIKKTEKGSEIIS